MKRSWLRIENEDGFTLIEAMATIVILAVALLALAGLLINSIRTNAASDDRMDAASIAQSIATMVDVYASSPGYTQAQAVADAQALLGPRYDANGRNGGYKPVVLLSPDPTTSGTYASVIIKLQWDDHGSMKTVELRTGVATN